MAGISSGLISGVKVLLQYFGLKKGGGLICGVGLFAGTYGTWLDEQIFADFNATFTFFTLPTIAELYALNGSHVSKKYSEKNAVTFLITSSTLTCTDTKSERK